MLTAEENLRLLEEIDANRRFLLLMLRSNPELLARADERIRWALTARQPSAAATTAPNSGLSPDFVD